MHRARPLPDYLARRYRGWRATSYAENRAWYRRLAAEGQRPRVMVISCCDSRVHVTQMFGAEQGEFFIHRNIASLVPPYRPDGDLHGTSAAIEYGVRALRVTNVLVLGHTGCGGVRACDDLRSGRPSEAEGGEFVPRWLSILDPGWDRVAGIEDDAARRVALEREAVLVSITNLLSFPFVAERVAAGELTVHGCVVDISEGDLAVWTPEHHGFDLLAGPAA